MQFRIIPFLFFCWAGVAELDSSTPPGTSKKLETQLETALFHSNKKNRLRAQETLKKEQKDLSSDVALRLVYFASAEDVGAGLKERALKILSATGVSPVHASEVYNMLLKLATSSVLPYTTQIAAIEALHQSGVLEESRLKLLDVAHIHYQKMSSPYSLEGRVVQYALKTAQKTSERKKLGESKEDSGNNELGNKENSYFFARLSFEKRILLLHRWIQIAQTYSKLPILQEEALHFVASDSSNLFFPYVRQSLINIVEGKKNPLFLRKKALRILALELENIPSLMPHFKEWAFLKNPPEIKDLAFSYLQNINKIRRQHSLKMTQLPLFYLLSTKKPKAFRADGTTSGVRLSQKCHVYFSQQLRKLRPVQF